MAPSAVRQRSHRPFAAGSKAHNIPATEEQMVVSAVSVVYMLVAQAADRLVSVAALAADKPVSAALVVGRLVLALVHTLVFGMGLDGVWLAANQKAS